MTQSVYTVKELAALWHCSESAVYDLLVSGKLKGFKIGRAWRITDEARSTFEQTPAEKSVRENFSRTRRPAVLHIT